MFGWWVGVKPMVSGKNTVFFRVGPGAHDAGDKSRLGV
jgi:hypothetical protein